LETFFLMVEKRSMRTLFFQDLCCGHGACPERGDMTAGRPAGVNLG
jgi:hypothetical protein